MTPTQIIGAFRARLLTLPNAPAIVWEDEHADPARPYLAVQHVPASRVEPGMAGGGAYTTGYFAVTVVTARGQQSHPAHAIAAGIIAHFPKALPLGRLRITGARLANPGFTDGTDYRLPVRIDYIAT